MATIKKYNGSSWENAVVRKFGTATEAVENPLYSDGTAITAYTLKGNEERTGTPSPSNPVMSNGVGERTENLFDTSILENNYHLDSTTGLPVTYNGRIGTTQPIDVAAINSVVLSLTSIATGTLFMYSLFSGTTLIRRVAGVSLGAEIDVSDGNKLYIAIYAARNITVDDVSNIMLNTGSTALPYEPYGFKIPISSGGVTTNIYLGSTQTVRQIKKLVLDSSLTFTKNSGSATNYLYHTPITPAINDCLCTHLQLSATNPVDVIGIRANPSRELVYLNFGADIMNAQPSGNTPAGLKEYLESQKSNGTPVTFWYVLATPETAAVNEPLMKIGNYADTLSNAAQIPTTEGANSITVDTTVQPSEFTATWSGWHDAAVKEWDGSDWQ